MYIRLTPYHRKSALIKCKVRVIQAAICLVRNHQAPAPMVDMNVEWQGVRLNYVTIYTLGLQFTLKLITPMSRSICIHNQKSQEKVASRYCG